MRPREPKAISSRHAKKHVRTPLRLAQAARRVPSGGGCFEPAWMFDLQASLVSLAMGLQTATFRRIDGVTVRTTYITGMLTNFGEEPAGLLAGPRDSPGDLREAARHLGVTGMIRPSFVAGAAASALAYARWRVHALAIPLLLLVSLVVLDLVWPVGGSRGTAAWRRRRSGE